MARRAILSSPTIGPRRDPDTGRTGQAPRSMNVKMRGLGAAPKIRPLRSFKPLGRRLG